MVQNTNIAAVTDTVLRWTRSVDTYGCKYSTVLTITAHRWFFILNFPNKTILRPEKSAACVDILFVWIFFSYISYPSCMFTYNTNTCTKMLCSIRLVLYRNNEIIQAMLNACQWLTAVMTVPLSMSFSSRMCGMLLSRQKSWVSSKFWKASISLFFLPNLFYDADMPEYRFSPWCF